MTDPLEELTLSDRVGMLLRASGRPISVFEIDMILGIGDPEAAYVAAVDAEDQGMAESWWVPIDDEGGVRLYGPTRRHPAIDWETHDRSWWQWYKAMLSFLPTKVDPMPEIRWSAGEGQQRAPGAPTEPTASTAPPPPPDE